MYEDTDVKTVPEELKDARSGIVIERPTGKAQYQLWHNTIQDTLNWLCGREGHVNPNGHATWRNNIRLARGQHWAEQAANSEELNRGADLIEDHVTVSYISLHIENLVAYLAQNDPYFKGRGRRPQDLRSAKAQEAVLNYFWEELQYTAELKKCIRDYATIGHMVARTDWFSRDEMSMMKVDKTDNPEASSNYDSYVRPEHPGFRRVNPFTFLMDRATPSFDLKGARWCGEIMARPLGDIVADERYSKKVRDAIRRGAERPTTMQEHLDTYGEASEGDTFWSVDDEDNADQMGLLVEVWDKRFRMRYVFAMGVLEPLVEEPWPYGYLDDFPYEFANFIPIPNEIYGISHPHLAGQSQLLLDRLRTKMALHVRKHNPKYQVPEGALKEDQKRRLISDEDGAIIEHAQGKPIEVIEPAQLPFDFQQAMSIVQQDMNQLTNTDALHRGGALPSRTSAQEIETRTQLHGMKLSDHAATIDRFVRNIGRQLLQHIKANMQQERYVAIAGRVGTEYVAVSPEDIQADIDIQLESSSREVITPAVEREQRMTLLNTLTTIIPQILQIQQIQAQQGTPVTPVNVNFGELLKQVLATFDGIEADRIFPAMGQEPETIPAEYVPADVQGSPNPPAPQPEPTGVNLAQSARQQFAPPTPGGF